VVSRADRCCVCDPIDHGGSSFPVALPPTFVFCGPFQNRQLAPPGFLTPHSSCSRPTGRSRSQAGLIVCFGMGRKRRKSAGKRRGSSFPRDLWGRTASARDTTYSPDQVRTGALQAVFSSGNRVPRAVVACPSGTVTSRRGHETHRHNYTRPPASLGDELLAICSIAQLTCCEPCMYRHHICSRWLAGSVESTNTRGRAAGVLSRQSVSTWRRRWSAGSCGAG